MQPRSRIGFTLVELLVVIAVIGMLMAMLLPAVQGVREAGRRTQCGNNLRQMSLAALNYESTHHKLPAGATATGLSTHALLLPYIEQTALYESIDFNQSYTHANNDVARTTPVPMFICASNVDQLPSGLGGRNNYYANAGVQILFSGIPATNPSDPNSSMPPSDGIFYNLSKTRIAEIIDGQSNTALFSERITGDGSNAVSSVKSDTYRPGTYPSTPDEALADANAVDITDLSKQGFSNVGAPWLRSYHSTTRYWHVNTPNGRSAMFPPNRIMTTASSYHPGGVQLGLADGSTRFVNQAIDLNTWRWLGSRNDRQVIPDF